MIHCWVGRKRDLWFYCDKAIDRLFNSLMLINKKGFLYADSLNRCPHTASTLGVLKRQSRPPVLGSCSTTFSRSAFLIIVPFFKCVHRQIFLQRFPTWFLFLFFLPFFKLNNILLKVGLYFHMRRCTGFIHMRGIYKMQFRPKSIIIIIIIKKTRRKGVPRPHQHWTKGLTLKCLAIPSARAYLSPNRRAHRLNGWPAIQLFDQEIQEYAAGRRCSLLHGLLFCSKWWYTQTV